MNTTQWICAAVAVIVLVIVLGVAASQLCSGGGNASTYNQKGFMRMRTGRVRKSGNPSGSHRRRGRRWRRGGHGWRPWRRRYWNWPWRYRTPTYYGGYWWGDNYWAREWVCTPYGCESVAPGTGDFTSLGACQRNCYRGGWVW